MLYHDTTATAVHIYTMLILCMCTGLHVYLQIIYTNGQKKGYKIIYYIIL